MGSGSMLRSGVHQVPGSPEGKCFFCMLLLRVCVRGSGKYGENLGIFLRKEAEREEVSKRRGERKRREL